MITKRQRRRIDELVGQLVEAEREDVSKGAYDPDDIEFIETELKAAKRKLTKYLDRLEKT